MKIKFALAMLLIILAGCTSSRDTDGSGRSGNLGAFKVGKPYQISGNWYYPQESYTYDETGIASWYGPGFHGQKTANGEIYHQGQLTAAHRTLQMPSFVRVTNLSNGKSVVLRVNDRGPFARGRIIDVSEQAAILLGFKNNGTARVRVQVLPEASRQIAAMAQAGKTWDGVMPTEDGQAAIPGSPTAVAAATLPAPGVSESAPRPYEVNGQPVPAHIINGEFYPDPIVEQKPVPATSAIYIQAGAFSQRDNAQHLADSISQLNGMTVSAFVVDKDVNGTTFHRVRVGPISSVSEADKLIAKVAKVAPEARTIVE